MVVIWALASLAMAGKDCEDVEAADKAECERDAARANLEAKIKELGKCKADRLVAQARCLQDRADLAQQVADLYASALQQRKEAQPKAVRSKSNHMDADVSEE